MPTMNFIMRTVLCKTIQWVFEIIDPLGQKRRLEEISLQTWKADKIIQEQFFYDSAKAWHPVD